MDTHSIVVHVLIKTEWQSPL